MSVMGDDECQTEECLSFFLVAVSATSLVTTVLEEHNFQDLNIYNKMCFFRIYLHACFDGVHRVANGGDYYSPAEGA